MIKHVHESYTFNDERVMTYVESLKQTSVLRIVYVIIKLVDLTRWTG